MESPLAVRMGAVGAEHRGVGHCEIHFELGRDVRRRERS